jgi:hypothetical protein
MGHRKGKNDKDSKMNEEKHFCVNCTHCKITDENYGCVTQTDEINYVTGKNVTETIDCRIRNRNGKCKRFEQKKACNCIHFYVCGHCSLGHSCSNLDDKLDCKYFE